MRGGKNEERLYLFDCSELGIEKTDLPDMEQLVARHKARYHLAAFLARPGMDVLDFPCGSGYGKKILGDVNYVGMDSDDVTIQYNGKMYGHSFIIADMKDPNLPDDSYDLICCIEGLEHIEMVYQQPLINKFYESLKPGGKLLVSMPEAKVVSGPSKTNPYHLHELTYHDFSELLWAKFPSVYVIAQKDTLHNGNKATLLYGICEKGDK
jgi:SAM-dependent methyltransferase